MTRQKWCIVQRKKIVELMEDIASMPTEYFEAKPMRSVWLDEIAKAVIPSTTDQKVIERLEGLNIPYEVYEAGNEDARTRALAEAEEVRFSINVDNSDYGYETLKKKEDIHLKSVEDLGLKAFEYSSDLKVADVLKTARENIATYNRKMGRGDTDNVLYNKDLGRNVYIGRDGLKHGFSRMDGGHANAIASIPVYFEDAIVFNETEGKRKDADKAYVLFGAYNDGDSTKIVRMVLSHYKDGVQIDDIKESLYAISAKKEKAAAHLAAPIQSKSSFRRTFSDLTITQLMYAVKANYPNELSEDVASHLEYKRGKSDIEGLRYSLDVDDTFWDILLNDSPKMVHRSTSAQITRPLSSHKS